MSCYHQRHLNFDSNPIPDHLCKCVRECVLDPSQNSDPKPDQRVEPIESIKSTEKIPLRMPRAMPQKRYNIHQNREYIQVVKETGHRAINPCLDAASLFLVGSDVDCRPPMSLNEKEKKMGAGKHVNAAASPLTRKAHPFFLLASIAVAAHRRSSRARAGK